MDPESEASQTITKQNFLKEHIVNKNYDPSQFAEFLESKKANGDRIENWSLRELVALVETYKRLPHILFPRLHDYSMASLFNNVVVNTDSPDDFVMQLEGEPAPIRRKPADTNWLLRTLAREHTTIQIPTTWHSDPKGQTVLLEYLFGLHRVLESPALFAFFRYAEADFASFKNVNSAGVQAPTDRNRPLPDRPPLPILPEAVPGTTRLRKRVLFPPPQHLPRKPD